MLRQVLAGASAAAAIALFAPADQAEAGMRVHLRYVPSYQTYYPGPVWIPAPRYYDYFDFGSGEEDDPDEIAPDEFDSSYYEPEYEPRVKKPAVGTAKPVTGQTKKTASKPTSKKPANGTDTTATKTESAKALTCDKATKIVTGYGFTVVRPTDCHGQVYAFDAKRDGKAYTIKLSSASGELTEVKKLQ